MLAALLFFFLLFFHKLVWAQECNEGDPRLDQLCRQISKLSQEAEQLNRAIQGAEESLKELEQRMKRIRVGITQAHQKIKEIENDIFRSEVELEFQRRLAYVRVRAWYMHTRTLSPLLVFFDSKSLDEMIKKIAYQKVVAFNDEKVIRRVLEEINRLNDEKDSLQKNSERLLAIEKQLDQQAQKLRKDIKGAKDYSQKLASKISQLTAEQQRILAEKTGTFQTSVGETPPVDDPCAGPPGASNFCKPSFSPAFGGFSFGAPHRKGMSQFGAYGRAKSGQDYEQILKAYYGDIRIETISSPSSIATSLGTLPFEDNYLMGIAEMPSVWGERGGMEALKAQAIAARTYALSFVGWRMTSPTVKKSICTTEACQVYSPSKAANTPSTWREAVNATRGKIIVSNKTGEIISAWYASTAGGYIYSYSALGHQTLGLWDTVCSDQSCWPNSAYEKIAASPWFYKGWYKTRSGKSCGRSHPWLTKEEFADIINALIVYTNDSSTLSHLSQTDGCWGSVSETWSAQKVRSEAARFGGAVSSINSVRVEYSKNGYTASVVLNTDKGEFKFSGDDFKLIFNLRAPGAIHLKSRLFNIIRI